MGFDVVEKQHLQSIGAPKAAEKIYVFLHMAKALLLSYNVSLRCCLFLNLGFCLLTSFVLDE